MSGAVTDLVLVEQFLNTLDERTFKQHGRNHATIDELTSVEALSEWMGRRGLVAREQELRPSDLVATRSLRAALRAALTSSAGGARTVEALAAYPLQLTTDSLGRLRLTGTSGWPGLDVIVEAVAVSVATGRWSRLKLCASPDCRWAFYDTSRSGGGRWCSMEVCGNRHKTRAYRQRQVS